MTAIPSLIVGFMLFSGIESKILPNNINYTSNTLIVKEENIELHFGQIV